LEIDDKSKVFEEALKFFNVSSYRIWLFQTFDTGFNDFLDLMNLVTCRTPGI
jgi:hypothetical protein